MCPQRSSRLFQPCDQILWWLGDRTPRAVSPMSKSIANAGQIEEPVATRKNLCIYQVFLSSISQLFRQSYNHNASFTQGQVYVQACSKCCYGLWLTFQVHQCFDKSFAARRPTLRQHVDTLDEAIDNYNNAQHTLEL